MRTPSSSTLRSQYSRQEAPLQPDRLAAAMEHLMSLAGRSSGTSEEVAEALNLLSAMRPDGVARAAGSVQTASEIDPSTYTQSFLDFINGAPTVFHAVKYLCERLDSAGFTKLSAKASWDEALERGGKYYLTRNGSSIVAFTVPMDYEPGNGVAMIAGHIDALTARLKPVSKKGVTKSYLQLGVAPYAGGLNSTWWDRDLGIGGRVIVKTSKGIESKLVKLDWPIARIPTLAPHFGLSMTGNGNRETQMVPVIGLENGEDRALDVPVGSFAADQPPRLVKTIASECGVKNYEDIINWELELFDIQPGQLLGLSKELLSAPRIDDKLCSFSALEALIIASKDLAGRGTINMVGLFDDEEVGSQLRQGAKGNFLSGTVERIVDTFGSGKVDVQAQTYANSFLISADVTHAVNPNFVAAYMEHHDPKLNVGLSVSADPNANMTTDAMSSALMQRIADKSDSKLQVFQIRNDVRSGGTVGPMLSTAMGVRAIDAGLPQLSMHSIRATTGALDPGLGVKIFAGFFEHFEAVDAEFTDYE